jgi:hypothetical protein
MHLMSKSLQFEIDPLKVSEEAIGGVLIGVDVLSFSTEDYPQKAGDPICIVAAAHTSGLSSISKVYTRLFVAGSATIDEEGQVLASLNEYLGKFNTGTLTAHYGFGQDIAEGYDLPYIMARAKECHPQLYVPLMTAAGKYRQHDICRFAKENTSMPSTDMDDLEGYYGIPRNEASILDGDVRSAIMDYWKAGDGRALRYAVANVYDCIRIAQAQIRRSVCCTDVPL